ncbi:winged helix-turn-helix domain-containing protein [Streptomyces sp. NPDC050982]|uniref:winged helix-turn-helix domain-containing protein n=1 Tax=Streptomyces sp. NPDC050982 TaxID=3154746 RepID=UPI0033CD26C6
MQRWRRSWTKGGPRALRTAGSASPPRLSEAEFAELVQELAKGPVAHSWPDQRWTLARIKTVIGRRFHKGYTLQGVRKLLIRHASPARCRPDGPSSATRSRSPAG